MTNNRLSRDERKLIGSYGGHKSWTNTVDRTARTANARNALEDKFLREADGDPKRAENIRKAHYKAYGSRER